LEECHQVYLLVSRLPHLAEILGKKERERKTKETEKEKELKL